MSKIVRDSDMAANYARRYTGSYQGRFKSQTSVLQAEKKLIMAVVNKSLEVRGESEEGQFKILDFAGGGGRLFDEYQEILKLMQGRGLSLQVICYDIIGVDDAYKRILTKNNFTPTRGEEEKVHEDHPVKTVATYRNPKGDMEFKFVQGSVISRRDNFDDVSEAVKAEVGMVDASISIFGGISHVMGRNNRQKILRTINDQTRGYVGVTLPSLNAHKEEVRAYAVVRRVDTSLGLEEGDAEYRAEDGNPYPYHHYDLRRLHEDFIVAGFPETAKFEIANIAHPLALHLNSRRDFVDSAVSGMATSILPDSAQDKIASYFQVLSPSAACHERQTPRTSSEPIGESGATRLLDGRSRGCSIM